MQHLDEHRFIDADTLAEALATAIQRVLRIAIAARGRASLVVSGGRTPQRFFNRLAALPLDWRKVVITLADERWVEIDSPSSNEQLVRRELLRDEAANAQFIGLKSHHVLSVGAQTAWRALADMPRPFDAIVLGMGDDGHTASLFPASPQLADALNSALPPDCVVMLAPVAPQARVSLNLAALLNSRRIVLHLQGAEKWAAYQQARVAGPIELMPVRAVLHQHLVPIEVFWSP